MVYGDAAIVDTEAVKALGGLRSPFQLTRKRHLIGQWEPSA